MNECLPLDARVRPGVDKRPAARHQCGHAEIWDVRYPPLESCRLAHQKAPRKPVPSGLGKNGSALTCMCAILTEVIWVFCRREDGV